MNGDLTVSVIITSYNYDRFLGAAIESALAQTYAATEVIVVDDGSSDGSREVIARFGARVRPILKENGGQASAFNAGLAASTGDLVCFVDSDDLLLPSALEAAVRLFRDSGVVKVHWPLHLVDEDGRRRGEVMHRGDLAEGNLRETVAQRGPGGYNWPPTSGNVWSRSFLDQVFPVPEQAYRIGPDVYLSALAPLFGRIARCEVPHGCYRLHQDNNTHREPFAERVASAVAFWDHSFGALQTWCERLGVASTPERWPEFSWWHRTWRAIDEIGRSVPAGASFILVDENHWVTNEVAGRRALPFLERDGAYWGRPADDAEAIRELERMRADGAAYLVLTWSVDWYEDVFPVFLQNLRDRFPCAAASDLLTIYDIRSAPATNQVEETRP